MKDSICIIAEAGVNHNGDIKIAKKLVDKAKWAGADYIKFQTFNPEKLVSKYANKADYQKKTTGEDESQLDMLKKLALSEEEFIELQRYCKDIGIGFLSTPFDFDSIKFLDEFNMDFWKIPSGEITNRPYLECIANTKKDVVISTGMSSMQEIKEAIQILEEGWNRDIVILQCNTQYPTPYEDVNLLAMKTIQLETNKKVGYSDHTEGIEISLAAVALGACVIEKHFTLDRNMKGPDHKASIEPDDLKKLVQSARNIQKSLGNGVKEISKSEKANVEIVRKSIVASKDISVGDIFSEDNLTIKRPGTGISPMNWNALIGKKSKHNYDVDKLILLDEIN